MRKSQLDVFPGKSCAIAEAANARKIQGEASCTDRRIRLTVDSGVEIPINSAAALIAMKVIAAIVKNNGHPLSALCAIDATAITYSSSLSIVTMTLRLMPARPWFQ